MEGSAINFDKTVIVFGVHEIGHVVIIEDFVGHKDGGY